MSKRATTKAKVSKKAAGYGETVRRKAVAARGAVQREKGDGLVVKRALNTIYGRVTPIPHVNPRRGRPPTGTPQERFVRVVQAAADQYVRDVLRMVLP